MTIFDFFKIRFLGFYKAELESEDIFVLRRVRAFHIVDLEVSYDVLSPLPIVLSLKHFSSLHSDYVKNIASFLHTHSNGFKLYNNLMMPMGKLLPTTYIDV